MQEAIEDRGRTIQIAQMGVYHDNIGESCTYRRNLFEKKIDEYFGGIQ